ncbi:matrix metalloproteinase-21-like [Hyla sarda]|uniref:matrix metalloproteinase-21-like n=1 Tax=Hyla sarda TaxID=327740 RepID=UPI0024C28A22|nr:matrix metalloproteinase-21-like [Hyla sarda]XP_056407476.1 matrix metalloproteinase-21-like [Hyla sarda]
MESTSALLALLFIHMSHPPPAHSDLQTQPRDKSESILTKTYAQTFLLKYGWMEPVHWDSLPFRGVPAASTDVSSLPSEGQPSPSNQPDIPKYPEPTLNPRFIGALKRFQEANRLKVTGELDEATREAMNAPRCGVPDRKIPVVEKTEDVSPTKSDPSKPDINQNGEYSHVTMTPVMATSQRIQRDLMGKRRIVHPETEDNQKLERHVRKKRGDLLRAGTKKVAFSKATIKWRLLGEGYSVWLTIDQQRSILMRAFRIWSEVVPLNFEEDLTSPAHLIDIKLGFGTRRHLGCSQLFDGMGREFAHAWRLGDIHFDDDEHFVPPNSDQGISLLKVAVHEIGHVLGLSHMNRITSVMQPNYIPANSRMELDGTDRRAIQRIYGQCSGRFSTVFDWVHQDRSSPGNWVFQTYFFRKSWYWMYENRSKRTRYRDPRILSNGWRGIPDSNIDAFLHIWSRDKDLTLFFKGTQYWRYDNENDRAYVQDPEGHVYPRLISDGFPGINGPIDTALYDRKERNVYFFRGRNVTAFSVDNHTVVPGYPRAITDVFPAHVNGDHPQSDLDAVYYSFTHKSVFFIKDEYVWRMVGDRDMQYSASTNALLPRSPINDLWSDICDVHPSMLSAPRR